MDYGVEVEVVEVEWKEGMTRGSSECRRRCSADDRHY